MAPPVSDPDLPTAADIEALRAEVAALNRHMEHLVEEKIAEKAVPREELADRLRSSGKRTVAGLVAVLLLAAGLVLFNRVTLLQSRHDLNTQIVRCFLRPGENTPAQAQACADRFGNGYVETQQRSRAATTDFVDLRRWAKERGWEPPSER